MLLLALLCATQPDPACAVQVEPDPTPAPPPPPKPQPAPEPAPTNPAARGASDATPAPYDAERARQTETPPVKGPTYGVPDAKPVIEAGAMPVDDRAFARTGPCDHPCVPKAGYKWVCLPRKCKVPVYRWKRVRKTVDVVGYSTQPRTMNQAVTEQAPVEETRRACIQARVQETTGRAQCVTRAKPVIEYRTVDRTRTRTVSDPVTGCMRTIEETTPEIVAVEGYRVETKPEQVNRCGWRDTKLVVNQKQTVVKPITRVQPVNVQVATPTQTTATVDCYEVERTEKEIIQWVKRKVPVPVCNDPGAPCTPCTGPLPGCGMQAPSPACGSPETCGGQGPCGPCQATPAPVYRGNAGAYTGNAEPYAKNPGHPDAPKVYHPPLGPASPAYTVPSADTPADR